jgi:hypothetical protein
MRNKKHFMTFFLSYQTKLFSCLLICYLIAFRLVHAQTDHDLPSVSAAAKAPPDPLFDKVAQKGINLTFHDQFEESLALFDSLILEYPDHPAPYFFKVATYQNWIEKEFRKMN